MDYDLDSETRMILEIERLARRERCWGRRLQVQAASALAASRTFATRFGLSTPRRER